MGERGSDVEGDGGLPPSYVFPSLPGFVPEGAAPPTPSDPQPDPRPRRPPPHAPPLVLPSQAASAAASRRLGNAIAGTVIALAVILVGSLVWRWQVASVPVATPDEPLPPPAAGAAVVWEAPAVRDSDGLRHVVAPLAGGWSPVASDTGSAVVVGDVLVHRLTQATGTAPVAVAALDLDDGSERWRLDLADVVCSPLQRPVVADEHLACAWTDDGAPRAGIVAAATGRVVREWPLVREATQVAGGDVGMVLLDPGEVGAGAITWYDVLGEPRWTWELGVDPGDVALIRAGDGVVAVGPAGAVAALEAGPSVLEACLAPQVVGDVVVCPETGAHVDGLPIWYESGLEVLPASSGHSAPALVQRVRGDAATEVAIDTYRWVDPTTGARGPDLVATDRAVALGGAPTLPLLVVDGSGSGEGLASEVVAIDPATGRELWSGEVARLPHGGVAVVGDRVLVEGLDAGWTVLDAATGVEVGTVPLVVRGWAAVAGSADALVVLQDGTTARIALP